MVRSTIFGCLSAALIGASVVPAVAQSSEYPSAPPESARNQDAPDMECRQRAAAEAGYATGGQTPSRDAQQQYAAAYYDCMRGGDDSVARNSYAYGPPPGYGPPPAYGPPPPAYYYGPDPYAYPYYPPYYAGPAIGFSFGFGGHRHWR